MQESTESDESDVVYKEEYNYWALVWDVQKWAREAEAKREAEAREAEAKREAEARETEANGGPKICKNPGCYKHVYRKGACWA